MNKNTKKLLVLFADFNFNPLLNLFVFLHITVKCNRSFSILEMNQTRQIITFIVFFFNAFIRDFNQIDSTCNLIEFQTFITKFYSEFISNLTLKFIPQNLKGEYLEKNEVHHPTFLIHELFYESKLRLHHKRTQTCWISSATTTAKK